MLKWQEHSFWFNRCIDARNLFVYWLYLVVALLINISRYKIRSQCMDVAL